MIHHGVEAADVSEHEVEEAVREDALHEADKVLGEVDAAVAQVELYGTEGLAGHFLRRQDAEEGVDTVEHARVDEVRGDGGHFHRALLAVQFDGSLSLQALKQATAAGTVLHETLHPLGFTSEQVREIHDNLEGESGKLWESRQGHRLLRDRDRLLMQRQKEADSSSPVLLEGSFIPLDGYYEGAHGLRLLIRRQSIDPSTFVIPRDAATACFDLEKLTLPLSIRPVRYADRFRPFGMTGSRLLSDFLTDRKLSLFDKERQQVILSGDQIVWVH